MPPDPSHDNTAPAPEGDEVEAQHQHRETDQRWYSHQPNVTGKGIIASYTPAFWGLALILGVVCGITGSALIGLLYLVERIAYGAGGAGFVAAVHKAPDWRHLVALEVAAVIVIVGVRVLGRLPTSAGREVSDALWLKGGRLDFVASVARALISIVTVGLGVSLGRETAPQLVGSATASKFSDWMELPLWQRRLLVASGAGAAFAAVYNVPLGGTLLALEVMLGTLALPLVLPALVTCVTATAVGWIALGTGPTYLVPDYHLHPGQLLWAVLMGPIIGLLSVAWVRMIAIAARRRPTGRGRYLAPPLVFAALALVAVRYPLLLGNGKDIVQLALVGKLSIGMMAALFVLKPLATSSSIYSGAPGGLFTPTLAIGVLFTGVAGIAWSHLWPGAASGSYSLIGGGAFLAASMQGPLAGVVIILELTRHFDALMVPTLIAVAEATIIARLLRTGSIYSARLTVEAYIENPTAGAAALATLHALDETMPAEMAEAPSGARVI